MALVLEDGTGLANSNSYATVQEFRDFGSLNINNAATIEDMDDDEVIVPCLILATAYIDQLVNWYGQKSVDASALLWPRKYVKNLDGTAYLPEDEIPVGLKRATIDLAFSLSKEDRYAESETIGISEMKVDVIELKFDKNDVKSPLPQSCMTWLKGLGSMSFGYRSVKVVRS